MGGKDGGVGMRRGRGRMGGEERGRGRGVGSHERVGRGGGEGEGGGGRAAEQTCNFTLISIFLGLLLLLPPGEPREEGDVPLL